MATGDLDLLDDERAVELSSIEAIYPELKIESKTRPVCKATIDIEVSTVSPLHIVFTSANDDLERVISLAKPLRVPAGTDSIATKPDTGPVRPPPEHAPGNIVRLQHLPSLKCSISLPASYPATDAPQIRLTCDTPWLSDPRLHELEQQAAVLWKENGRDVVLFDYLDWLGQSAQSAFGLLDHPAPVTLSRGLETSLLDFDLQAKRAKFERETFDCGVCLEPKKGVSCHKMVDCGHVFCKACLQDFYSNCIAEGDVASVKCLNPGCEKQRLLRIPEKKRPKVDLSLKAGELVEIQVESATVQRYLRMKRKKELESNKNTVFCPRKWCQGAARPQRQDSQDEEKDDADTDLELEAIQAPPSTENDPSKPFGERLAICSDCSFAFCSRCLNGWHGEHIACLPPRTQKELSEEERATEAYLSEHSTRCPTCGSPVQKTFGCNHMLCQLCRTHFCYLCSAYLMESNPYVHYNTPGQGCYQQLWVLEGGDYEGAPAAVQIDDVPGIVIEEDHIAVAVAAAAAAAAAAPPIAAAAPAPAQAQQEVVVVFEDDTESSEEDEVAPPPAAPVPPARGRGRGRGGGGRGGAGGGNRGRGDARGRGGRGDDGRRGQHRAQAQAQAREQRAAGPAGPARGPLPAHEQNALQRFLELAMRDMEDEWDSDELDSDDDENWAIPVR